MNGSTQRTIVFVGHGASRTGAPASLLKVIRWIATNTGHPCILVLGNDGPLVQEYSKYAAVYVWNKPIKVNPVRQSVFGDLFERVNTLVPRTLSRHRARIIRQLGSRNIGCIFNNTGVNGHILEALKSAIKVPVISRIPELEAYMRKNNRNGSVDRILALTDHFVAVSNAVKSNLIDRHAIPPERVSVIYGSCDTLKVPKGALKLRDKLGVPSDAFLVGGCGMLEYHKGIDLFIQVANYCRTKLDCPEVYFCWIGACVSQDSCIEYKYEIEQLQLGDRFFFLGEIADTAPYFAEMDLFLLTSREDSFPLVMLEAARQGVPIACFSGGGGATEFVDDSTGFTLTLLDVEGMARSVIDLHNKPELRASLGTRAHEKSLGYTPERMGKEIYEVMTGLMAR